MKKKGKGTERSSDLTPSTACPPSLRIRLGVGKEEERKRKGTELRLESFQLLKKLLPVRPTSQVAGMSKSQVQRSHNKPNKTLQEPLASPDEFALWQSNNWN